MATMVDSGGVATLTRKVGEAIEAGLHELRQAKHASSATLISHYPGHWKPSNNGPAKIRKAGHTPYHGWLCDRHTAAICRMDSCRAPDRHQREKHGPPLSILPTFQIMHRAIRTDLLVGSLGVNTG